ncbi:MAG: alpha-ketoglutarate-dependent dioxygenase AlkB [Planctomycetota bacterium]
MATPLLESHRLPLPEADVFYVPDFFAPSAAARLAEALRAELRWETKVVRLFGRELPSPRLTAFCGDPGATYRYSGLTLKPAPWTAGLAEVRDTLHAQMGARFNCVLANLYRDGGDSMGWHSDDERELGAAPVIASLSFGAVRRFLLRHRQDPARRAALDLAPGSLLWMAGATQRWYRHSVPKTRRPVGPRVNLTFRRIVGSP